MHEFKAFIEGHGLIAPDVIPVGQKVRFAGFGKPKGNQSAVFYFFPDGLGGWVKDYSTGQFVVWQSKRAVKPFSRHEIAALKADAEAVDLRKQAKAADKARFIWSKLPLVSPSHAYLACKGIEPHGAKAGRGDSLVIPLFNPQKELVNLQFILPEGSKRFLTGGRKQGCYWWLGKRSNRVLIAEGFATAASLFEYSGCLTVIAFDAGNLLAVAKTVRARLGESVEIIVCGDNDASGTGQKAARAAAVASGGRYLLPKVIGHDFNDLLAGGAL